MRSIILPLLLTACATNDAGWEVRPSHPPLPAVFVDATPEYIQAACPKVYKPSGCAVRYYTQNVCRIYVEPGTPHWLAGHELEHCAGFDHS